MNEFITALRNIGLSEKESAIYLALLELGPSTVSEVASHAEIKRPTAYFVIEDLLKRGLIAQAGGQVKRFIAERPEKIIAQEQRRLKQLEKILPGLSNLAHSAKHKPAVRFFTGEEAIRSVYEESLLLPAGNEILTLGNARAVEDNLEGFGEWYIQRRVKGKIKMRALVTDNPYHRTIVERDKKELRETRLIEEELFTQDMEMNVYRNTIALVGFMEEELIGVLLDSQMFANGFRQMFELLWAKTK